MQIQLMMFTAPKVRRNGHFVSILIERTVIISSFDQIINNIDYLGVIRNLATQTDYAFSEILKWRFLMNGFQPR